MPKLPVDNANQFAEWLLTDYSHENSTVMVAPGDGFYASSARGTQEVRIAYVLKEDDLRAALQILVKAVEVYNGCSTAAQTGKQEDSTRLNPSIPGEQVTETNPDDAYIYGPLNKATSAIPVRVLPEAESEEAAALKVVMPVARFILKEIGLPWKSEPKKYADLWREKFRPWIEGQIKEHRLHPYAVETAGNTLRHELEAMTDPEARSAWERFAAQISK